MKICHLTSAHSTFDTRIFHKECKSLAKKYRVTLICQGDKDEVVDGVFIKAINYNPQNRLLRMTSSVFFTFKKAINIDADIYHFHDPELIPVGIALKLKGKKVIYDIHEDYPAAILSKSWIHKYLRKIISNLFSTFQNLSLKIFDGVITVHDEIFQKIKKFNDNTIIIYNYPFYIKEVMGEKLREFVWLGGEPYWVKRTG